MSIRDSAKPERHILSQEQKVDWLRLYRSQNVGPVTFRDLISHFQSASAALEALPDLAKRGGTASRIKIFPKDQAEKELHDLYRLNGQLITLHEPDFPTNLKEADNSPPLLCCVGEIETLNKPCISIVGSRNASVAGQRLTQRFAGELSELGYVVVSGLARGIDSAAHRASINGGTIAVFAGGLNIIAPEENIPLANEILEQNGLWISEQPFNWQPRAQDFPKRNRIIAGMSSATLVIEAAHRSGSLITARLANEMGRQVLAVPGSPLDPRSDGPNKLIRNGATLVSSTQEIVEALAPIEAGQLKFQLQEDASNPENWAKNHSPQAVSSTEPNETERQQIIEKLSIAPVEMDDLLHFSGMTLGTLQILLLELDLAGRLERHQGNRVSVLP